jgi:hypothetical protein
MKYLFPLSLAAFPILVGAQSGVFRLLDLVSSLIRATVPVIIGLAVLVFIFGILKYVIAKDEGAQKEARSVILWGVIILFVMVSVWGLVNLLGETLQLNNSAPRGPSVPGF